MKKTINKSQFENMIAECVQSVIAESVQKKQKNVNRRVMNEAQVREYVQNIINEELENEGVWDFFKGAGKKVGGDVANATGNVATNVKNKMQNGYNNVKNGVKNAMGAVQNGYNNVKGYANDAMQAGRNASAQADVQKLVGQVDAMYQKYGKQLTKGQASSIRSAKSALTKLAAAFGDGSMNA